MLTALIGYAAVTLAFAGGVHWGFELQSRQQDAVRRSARGSASASSRRWSAGSRCCCRWWWRPGSRCVVLIAAYIGAVLLEQEAARRDLLPPRYLWLRWGFTVVAVAMMITVLTLRLLGQTISILRFVWILCSIFMIY